MRSHIRRTCIINKASGDDSEHHSHDPEPEHHRYDDKQVFIIMNTINHINNYHTVGYNDCYEIISLIDKAAGNSTDKAYIEHDSHDESAEVFYYYD